MKVLVVGATGQTGRRIVQELVNREIPLRAMVRNLQTAQEILPDGIDIVVGDVLDPNNLDAAIADCTTIICATGAKPSLDFTEPFRVDYEGTKHLVDASKRNNIKHFIIVSSLCVSNFFHPLNLFWLVLFWKKQAENYLQASGLTYTIVRPGGLRNDDDNTDPVVISQPDTLFEGSIPRQKVAQVCVEALSQPTSHNRVLEIVARSDAPKKSLPDLFQAIA